MIIDAQDHILGRLASHLVSELKDGEEVHVINAEKAIVKGNPQSINKKYQDKFEAGSRDFGPYFPRNPQNLLKRTVEGMLPDTQDGEDMRSRLKVYSGTPDDLDDAEVIEDAHESGLPASQYQTLQAIADHLGA
ncbi:MAG: 50S ribosomal protein L13 [Candidatus Nanohaloarchaeota archaeon QJJ-5]|nr:50S ribosomal protein L13 [Candidatus Nanohaloarchaeota archaeon QJJ-5]